MKNWKLLLITTAAAAVLAGCAGIFGSAKEPATCVISSKALDDSAFVHTHTDEDTKETSKVKLCCQDCVAKFNEDPDLYLAKYANLLDGYKTEICIVSDEPLGSMGKPIMYKHSVDGKEVTVKFCCGGCVDEFKEDPAKFLAKLKAATQGSAAKPEEKKDDN